MALPTQTITAICIALFSVLPGFIRASTDEARLLDKLLKGYQIYERPVSNESLPITLAFGISLQQIIDLDERNQLLKSNLWLEYTWEDANLRWNAVRKKRLVLKKI